MRKAIIVLLAIWLAGCVTAEQRAAAKAEDQRRLDADAQAVTANAISNCRSFGHTEGSGEFYKCVYDMRRQTYQSRIEILNRANTRQQTNTSCYQTGNIVQCSSY